MRRTVKINRILKLLLPMALMICVIALFSFSAFAEVEPFQFEMTEEPVYIDVKTTEEVVEFYENATTEDLLSPSANTFVKRQIVLPESAKPVEKDVVVHTFSLSDITETDIASAQESINEIMDEVFLEITSSLGKKYISTLVYLYGANYSMSYNAETGEVSETLLHVALALGENAGDYKNIVENYVRPNADKWRDLPSANKIIELNNFLLDGRFSYDISLKQRKSTYAFIRDGKGVCEEYAGLTSLFLDELGFENILVRGYTKNGTELEDHVWNLVNVDGEWYNLDILWDGPIDENGNHTDITTDYLLKSKNTVKSTHLVKSIYNQYTELAKKDFDLSPYLVPEEPEEPEIPDEPEIVITPEQELKDARAALAAAIDAAYDIVYRNYFVYTPQSVEKIMPYYTEAKAVYDNKDSTIDVIRNHTDTLSYAVENYAEVFTPADKTSLYRYLSRAYGVLLYDYELYDRATVEALIEPYEAAVDVYQNEYATQKEVDKAKNNLKTYVNQLVLLETENAEEPEQGTSSGTTGIIKPEDFKIIPNLPFTPGTRQEETPDPEQSGQENAETVENTENNSSETITDPPQDEQQNEPSQSEETETPSETTETQPEYTEETPITEPETNPEPESPGTPSVPELDPTPEKEAFSWDAFFRSDIPFYILIALVAFGGILYLLISRIRTKNSEVHYIDIDEEDDDFYDDEFDDKKETGKSSEDFAENSAESQNISVETTTAENSDSADTDEVNPSTVSEKTAPEPEIEPENPENKPAGSENTSSKEQLKDDNTENNSADLEPSDQPAQKEPEISDSVNTAENKTEETNAGSSAEEPTETVSDSAEIQYNNEKDEEK